MVRGVITVHAAQRAMHLHLEWAISRALGEHRRGFGLSWEPQPAVPGAFRAASEWSGPAGSGSAVASALAEWSVPFEVTEESDSGLGLHFMSTPELGIFAGRTDAAGSILVDEHRIHVAFAKHAGEAERLAEEFGRLLGVPWDEQLDSLRRAQDDSNALWMHRVG